MKTELDWIFITESKPDDAQRVLVVQEFLPDEREIHLARYIAGVDGWITLTVGTIHYNVTHWQPLPALPERDERREKNGN